MFSGFVINAFHSFVRKTASMDMTKPLIIPAGSDSFSQIGNLLKCCCPAVINSILVLIKTQLWNDSTLALGSPCTTDVDATSLHAKNPKDLWKKICGRVFPQEVGRCGAIVIIVVLIFSCIFELFWCFLCRISVTSRTWRTQPKILSTESLRSMPWELRKIR